MRPQDPPPELKRLEASTELYKSFSFHLSRVCVCVCLTMTVLQHQMQAEVVLRIVQPEVTCGGQVKGQPAFLCRPKLSLFQQQKLQITEDQTKTL